MRARRIWGAALTILFTLVFGAACADSTMPERRTADLGGEAGPANSDLVLPPVIVTVPHCDPSTDLNWCEGSGDGGGGQCMSGAGSEMSISSCPIGGGPGGGGGSTGATTGGSSGSSTGSPTGSSFTGPAAEGPLAWAACVLGVLNSAYSIDQVAGAFQSWYDAQRDYESARRMLDAIYANPAGTTQETISLWEFRVEYKRDQRDAAIDAVHQSVGGSYWALLGAGAACGVAAFLPTP